MEMKRSSGILLHITSLPSPYGIGDMGPIAYQWVDFLADAHCGLWQVLPLSPTGYGDSPYQSFSAFAGNPYLISPDELLADGLLTQDDLNDMKDLPASRVDFGQVIPRKLALLEKMFSNYQSHPEHLRADFDRFCMDNASWLDNYAFFMALKEANNGNPWSGWPEPLRSRKKAALDKAQSELAEVIMRHAFYQFIFFRQWNKLRAYANERRVQIIGDIPLFVAYDSADAWGNQELFFFDEYGEPTVVAGVPPDYFSPTGQLWGNPLFKWEYHRSTGFRWWINRIKANMQLFDVIRIDHFRGLAGYYEIPAESPTAEIGRWVPGPGKDFFESLLKEFGSLPPLIAEDLGTITPDVIELLDAYQLPGMKVLQFAFSGPDNPFLPHQYTPSSVVYTATFDNDACLGWFKSAPIDEREFCQRYLNSLGEDIVGDIIRSAWGSVANYALSPLQDFLRLDVSARMNFPGRLGGNWEWRFHAEQLTQELKEQIKEINYIYKRES
jgi:4-alpha-glucanotransferase